MGCLKMLTPVDAYDIMTAYEIGDYSPPEPLRSAFAARLTEVRKREDIAFNHSFHLCCLGIALSKRCLSAHGVGAVRADLSGS